MSQPSQPQILKTDQPQSTSTEPKSEPKNQPKSPTKTEAEFKKDRKKKERALKQFLAKPESDVIQVPRKTEEDPSQALTEATNCKICGELSQKRKQCDFCKDIVCMPHFRKKRKHKNSNKFMRICDDCEDKYIHDKYLKLEHKAEEAVAMQEMIVQAKHDELGELVASKQTKMAVLRARTKELEETKKEYDHKIRIEENDFNNKQKRFQNKNIQLNALEEDLKRLEDSLPRPLDDDYNCLVDQNNKINKELVKFEKLCSEALKAKSTREKELYEAYYKWEKKEAFKATTAKKEDCLIY